MASPQFNEHNIFTLDFRTSGVWDSSSMISLRMESHHTRHFVRFGPGSCSPAGRRAGARLRHRPIHQLTSRSRSMARAGPWANIYSWHGRVFWLNFLSFNRYTALLRSEDLPPNILRTCLFENYYTSPTQRTTTQLQSAPPEYES